MKITEREKMVLLLAPLAIILGGYAWWYNIFQRPKSQSAEQAYQAALTGQPNPKDRYEQQVRKRKLDRELADLQKQKADLNARAAVAAGREVDSRRRIENERRLGELLRKHGLQVADEGLPTNGNQGRLPASVLEALGRFGKSPGQQTVQQTAQVRHLRLVGTYRAVLDAMSELAAMPAPPGLPISLSMAEADIQETQRVWTLLVWI